MKLQLALMLGLALNLLSYGAYADSERRDTLEFFINKEAFLKSIDINNSETVFLKPLSEGNTTKTTWKVKLSADGPTVANLKCSSGNTNALGEITSYQIAKDLGMLNYAAAIPVIINREDIQIKNQVCALKEWVANFVPYFWSAQGADSENTFLNPNSSSKKEIVSGLKCEAENINMSRVLKIAITSAFGSPNKKNSEGKVIKVKYLGQAVIGDMIRDMSRIMVLDAVVGNNDRFPGGNLHLISVFQNVEDVNSTTLALGEIRLFSLDNGATFKGKNSVGMRDLKSYVSRFDKEQIEALKNLKKAIVDGQVPYVNFSVSNKLNAGQLVIDNIDFVLSEVARAEARCGTKAYFN